MSNGFDPGLGPDSLKNMPTRTVLTPSDTDASTKLIKVDMPLKWAGDGTSGLGQHAARCADGDVPELIAIERSEWPDYAIGVITIPDPQINTGRKQNFVVDLPVSNAAPAADDISVLADAVGTFKLVSGGATGIGRYLGPAGTGRALIQF
jgi:hypothetical protein